MISVIETTREGMGNHAPSADPICPPCGQAFEPRRKNQKYCFPTCQKAATRNTSRGLRIIENSQRNAIHFGRAAWLSYDVLRLSPPRQRQMILSILEAASGGDASLRNILLDPALLGADRWSSIGKLYPDTKSPDAPNIAKLVNVFCRNEWGVSVREAILDKGKPANRDFVGKEEGVIDPQSQSATLIHPPHIYEGSLESTFDGSLQGQTTTTRTNQINTC